MAPSHHFIELTYYETYYFANLLKNVLEDPFPYIRRLDDFYGDRRYLNYAAPFPQFSALHSFVSFIVDEVFSEDVANSNLDIRQDEAERFKSCSNLLRPHPSKFPFNLAFDRFGIRHEGFDVWLEARGRSFLEATDQDVEEYYDDLRLGGEFEELLERATAEIFFVLFQNRQTLLDFNEMMANQLARAVREGLPDSEWGDNFARPGVLRRVAIPSWVQRAVYFRDRGMCAICAADLSGILAIGAEENYDHMVPLATGGLNDVTNIQLLCRGCNLKKAAGEAVTTSRYEAWYPEHASRFLPRLKRKG